MTLDQRSVRARLKRLPDREANACAVSAVGVPEQAPDDQFQYPQIDPRPGERREWRPTAPPHAPRAHGPETQPHSKPIAQATRGAV
jgi:hypothetical protein